MLLHHQQGSAGCCCTWTPAIGQPGKRQPERARRKSLCEGERQCCVGMAPASCCNAVSLVAASQRLTLQLNIRWSTSTERLQSHTQLQESSGLHCLRGKQNHPSSEYPRFVLISTSRSSEEKLLTSTKGTCNIKYQNQTIQLNQLFVFFLRTGISTA